jgi:hypothetical protein
MATVTKDFRVKHGLVVEGTNATVNGSDIITEDIITGGEQTNITVTYNPSTKLLDFVAENGVEDSTTDDLEEGNNNLYFTDQRAIDAVGGSATSDNEPNTVVKRDGSGNFAASEITAQGVFVTGTLSTPEVKLDLGLGAPPGITEYPVIYSAMGSVYDSTPTVDAFEFKVQNTLFAKKTNDGNSIDIRADILQDSAGNGGSDVYLGASDNEDNLIATVGNVQTHSDLTTGVHGVTGDVVGTSDTQDLSNKRVIDTLYFTDGVTIANEGEIAVKPTTHEFEIKANYGNLDLKTTATDADVNITSDSGDIVLNASGNVYKDSVSTENEVITQGRLDNYLGDATIDGTGGNTVTDRIATAVADLVDGAPALLDTLNELAAAIGDDESFATTIATDIGTKVSKAGDTMTGALAMGTNKITGLGTPTDDYDAATKKYTDDTFVTLEDLPGQLDDYIPLTQKGEADGVATLDEDGQVPVTQLAHVTEAIDGLSTSDIEEGTNLYFTDVRAVDALEAVVPNFTAVEVNSVAKQVAATVSAPTSGDPVTAYAFAKATYRSAKFLVKVAHSTHTEVSEVLLTLDTSDNIAITEFAIVSTNGSASGISAGINDSNVELLVTPTNASSTVTVVGTLLA